MADYKIYEELSEDKKMNICLGVLFEMSFWELILILFSQINWKLGDSIYSVIFINLDIMNNSDIQKTLMSIYIISFFIISGIC